MKDIILYAALIASAMAFFLALAIMLVASADGQKSTRHRALWPFGIKRRKGDP